MKFRYVYLLLMCTLSNAQPPNTDLLEEINLEDPELIVLLDDQVRETCQKLVNVWRSKGTICDEEHVAQLLDPALLEIDYETVLVALHTCLDPERDNGTTEELNLRTKLQRMYEQLLDEYDQLVEQTSTRSIKCKYYCKLTTRDLIVNNNAYLENAIINSGLTIHGLDGVLSANNGRITAGDVPASEIPDGSITTEKLADDAVTNAKLADNAVTTNNIAPMTITPDDTAFNPVVATAGEARPLTTYRGSVTGATGTITSGTGFTVTRNGTGDYTVNLTAQAYTGAGTYQVFVQLLTETDPVTVTNVSGSQFNITTNAVDHDFSLFTIGA